MRGNTGLAVIAAAVLLAGCASQANAPVERRVVVSGAGFGAVRGEAGLTVRTFVEDPAGTRREVVGATCQVGSSLYFTTLVTPAQLVVPNFGPQSPELGFDCTAGDKRGRASRDIRTTWHYAPDDWPGGPLYLPGGPYGPYGPRGWPPFGYGWDRPAYPRSDYRDVAVILR